MSFYNHSLFFTVIFSLFLSFMVCQVSITSSVTEPSGTTPSKNVLCEKHDNDCNSCVAYNECYYCRTDKKCRFKSTEIMKDDECSLKEINYLTCPVSFSSSVTEPSGTTPSKNVTCEKHDNDCKACVAYSECYYCGADKKCRFKFTEIFKDDECSLKEVNYLTCRVNFQYMMIGIGVLIAIVFIIITIFCCYCCCKKKGIKISKDEIKWARQKEERQQIALEKRQARAERTEEIRKKYGLVKDSNPYQRFDA